jgi:hypothetical protein
MATATAPSVAPTAEQLEAYGGLVRELCHGQATDLHAEGLQVVVYPELPGFTWLVEAEGLRVSGRAASTDILEASAQVIKQKPPYGFLLSGPKDYQNYVDFYRNTVVKDIE